MLISCYNITVCVGVFICVSLRSVGRSVAPPRHSRCANRSPAITHFLVYVFNVFVISLMFLWRLLCFHISSAAVSVLLFFRRSRPSRGLSTTLEPTAAGVYGTAACARGALALAWPITCQINAKTVKYLETIKQC